MKTGVYCSYCAADLFDPSLERCTQCGMFVPDNVRALLAAKFPLAPEAITMPGPGGAATQVGPATAEVAAAAVPAEGVAVAAATATSPWSTALGSWQDLSLAAAQQESRRVFWQQVWLQAGIGLVVWSVIIIPLGRWGTALPYSWLPAGLGIFCGLLGFSRRQSPVILGLWLIAVVAMIVAAIL